LNRSGFNTLKTKTKNINRSNQHSH